jgi:hypothetical protein
VVASNDRDLENSVTRSYCSFSRLHMSSSRQSRQQPECLASSASMSRCPASGLIGQRHQPNTHPANINIGYLFRGCPSLWSWQPCGGTCRCPNPSCSRSSCNHWFGVLPGAPADSKVVGDKLMWADAWGYMPDPLITGLLRNLRFQGLVFVCQAVFISASEILTSNIALVGKNALKSS